MARHPPPRDSIDAPPDVDTSHGSGDYILANGTIADPSERSTIGCFN
jgi:hypothetical protein